MLTSTAGNCLDACGAWTLERLPDMHKVRYKGSEEVLL